MKLTASRASIQSKDTGVLSQVLRFEDTQRSWPLDVVVHDKVHLQQCPYQLSSAISS